ncbi:hypothetical protein [Serratia marcescens]|uniref:hypothetical protein n=1 Tax=Serratia marcescens TaxID=615 RepID=UPI0002AF3AAD|nr:hypothetical protein [Serratia marcescens]AGE18461.1 hypothetical protein SMWW4_v1c26660 [Serratia marcescens WW4]
MNTFIRMDYEICNQKEFNLTDRFVYAYLKGWQDSKGFGNVFPGIDRISSDLNIPNRTISTSISKLKKLGFIYVSRKDRRSSNNYLVRDLPVVTETATPEVPTAAEETANECTSNAPAPTIEPESQIEQPSQQTDNDHSDSAGACSGGVETVPNVTGWDRVSRKVWRSLKGRGLKKDSTRQEADTDARAYIINRLQHFTGPLEGVINQWLEEESLSF